MIKLITLISAFFFTVSLLGNAQSLVLHVPKTNISSDTANAIDASAVVVNTSANPITIKVQRRIQSLTSSHLSQFCWGGVCFSPNTSNSPLSETLNPGDSSIDFSGNIDPYDVIGTDVINYLFYDVNNAADTVSVSITYNFSATTGINVLNPASGSFLNCSQSNTENATDISYNINNFKNGKIVIRNLTGATVKEIALNDRQGVISVSTSDMASGMYMYFLYNNNEPLIAKKQIIWHQ